jgi:hypothetical protein
MCNRRWRSAAGGAPNKSKEIQGKPKKKAWIPLDFFGRIRTYQGVTANPNKKIFSRDTLYPKRHIRSFILLFNGRRASRGSAVVRRAETEIARIRFIVNRLSPPSTNRETVRRADKSSAG